MLILPLSVALVVFTTPFQFSIFVGSIVLLAALEWAILLGANALGRVAFVTGIGCAMVLVYQYPVVYSDRYGYNNGMNEMRVTQGMLPPALRITTH